MSNLGEMFYEEGIEKGRKEGLRRGIKQGLEEGLEKGLKKGLEKGMEKGKLDAYAGLVAKGLLPLEVAASEAGMSIENFSKFIKEAQCIVSAPASV